MNELDDKQRAFLGFVIDKMGLQSEAEIQEFFGSLDEAGLQSLVQEFESLSGSQQFKSGGKVCSCGCKMIARRAKGGGMTRECACGCKVQKKQDGGKVGVDDYSFWTQPKYKFPNGRSVQSYETFGGDVKQLIQAPDGSVAGRLITVEDGVPVDTLYQIGTRRISTSNPDMHPGYDKDGIARRRFEDWERDPYLAEQAKKFEQYFKEIDFSKLGK